MNSFMIAFGIAGVAPLSGDFLKSEGRISQKYAGACQCGCRNFWV